MADRCIRTYWKTKYQWLIDVYVHTGKLPMADRCIRKTYWKTKYQWLIDVVRTYWKTTYILEN